MQELPEDAGIHGALQILQTTARFVAADATDRF